MVTTPERVKFAYLSNGATTNAVGNYASAVEQFTFAPAPNRVFVAHRMIVYIEDVGTMDSGFYGNSVTLTNGISIVVRDASDNLILDLTDSSPVQTNAQWAAQCYDAKTLDFGQGNTSVIVRWTFANSGAPIRLDGDNGHYLAAELNDDFSGLVTHKFNLQGFYSTY